MEPSEEQYLVLNALTSLELLENNFYDPDSGDWYIQTPSPILPIAKVLTDGEIVPVIRESEI